MSAKVYIEGGGKRPELRSRCRKSFKELLEKSGLPGHQLKLVACGPRDEAFRSFREALEEVYDAHVAMLVDSEDRVVDIERTWAHLGKRDPSWERPKHATDDQVLFMTTCMETWIACDEATLTQHYGSKLQASALPKPQNLENRLPVEIQKALHHATRNCTNAYTKGQRSFEILGKLNPNTLERHLPSFARLRRILNEKLA